VITIGDSGPGIAPERAATLFSRFQNGVDTNGRSSTGLGLYIARAIAQAHGGEIQLDGAGRSGAWFEVRVPLRSSDATQRSATRPATVQAALPTATT
jgi:signal transduction histidine kinase